MQFKRKPQSLPLEQVCSMNCMVYWSASCIGSTLHWQSLGVKTETKFERCSGCPVNRLRFNRCLSMTSALPLLCTIRTSGQDTMTHILLHHTKCVDISDSLEIPWLWTHFKFISTELFSFNFIFRLFYSIKYYFLLYIFYGTFFIYLSFL